jgi:hypothetical protein
MRPNTATHVRNAENTLPNFNRKNTIMPHYHQFRLNHTRGNQKIIYPHNFNTKRRSKSRGTHSNIWRINRDIFYDKIIKSMPWHWKWLLSTNKRSKRRRKWSNTRAEEAKDKIYRLPPPGNGNQKQTNITDFFTRLQLNDNSADIQRDIAQHTQRTQPEHSEIYQSRQAELRILQWNACSMNEKKTKAARVSVRQK